MINTLNETHLHRTLKLMYAMRDEGSRTEFPVGTYIADIVTSKGSVIEIQTGSLSHLRAKIEYFLNEKRHVTVVYPLVSEKTIETRNPLTQKITRRKSPKKQGIYAVFRELTALTPYLLKKNFTLEVPLVKTTEERTVTEDAVQSQNGRRRVKKNWLKTGKRLDEIEKTYVFKSKKDYIALIPKSVSTPFTITEVYNALKAEGEKLTRDNVSLMFWVYTKLGILCECEKKGKTKLFAMSVKAVDK